MTKIQIHRNADGWTAFLGAPGKWEFGATKNEAIGRLVAAYGSELGLEVEGDEQDDSQISTQPLTLRQLDVLRSLLELRTDTEIGEHLGISVNTVKRHAQTIYEALGINGRKDLLPLVAAIESRCSRKAKGAGA